MGILALMLVLSGEVMSLAVRATGHAQALTEVNQALRIFERTLRDDLAAIDREKSVMLIQGNPINGYWTQEQEDSDDDSDPTTYPRSPDPQREDPNADRWERPRADILMFFTSRKEVTNYVRYRYSDPNIPREMRQAVSSNLQQVVYGHAELGEYVPATGTAAAPYTFEPDLSANPQLTMFPRFPDQNSDAIATIPAEHWHLARRSVLLAPFDPPKTVPNAAEWANWDNGLGSTTPSGEWLFNSTDIIEGTTDVMARFDYEDTLLTISTTPGPPYDTCSLPNVFPRAQDLEPGQLPVARSRLDLTPPPLYAGRLGHYFVSNCASFKVEWALDPDSEFVGGRLDGEKRLFWFDPGWVDPTSALSSPNEPGEGPLGSLAAAIEVEVQKNQLINPRLDRLQALHADELAEGRFVPYSLSSRFGGAGGNVMWNSCAYENGERANMAFFAATGETLSGQSVREDIFPAALRITVDLFDRERRLERPIRHVIVARVGG